MKLAATTVRVALVVSASLAPAVGCKALSRSVTPSSSPPPQQRGIDEPPPLHTGGLDVLGSTPAGQGPAGNPGSHGDPIAEGIATGIGIATVGATAARTANACARPDASATCLRGPGPADNERDAGP